MSKRPQFYKLEFRHELYREKSKGLTDLTKRFDRYFNNFSPGYSREIVNFHEKQQLVPNNISFSFSSSRFLKLNCNVCSLFTTELMKKFNKYLLRFYNSKKFQTRLKLFVSFILFVLTHHFINKIV